MTNKEYAINKLQDVINGLEDIKKKMLSDDIPTNEDWLNAATPLNSIMNIIGNYKLCKDNEFGTDVYSKLCK
jgi:hypothetical protein